MSFFIKVLSKKITYMRMFYVNLLKLLVLLVNFVEVPDFFKISQIPRFPKFFSLNCKT